MKDISRKDRIKKHMLLDKLLDGCYIEPMTHTFYCKKCNCVVTIDWKHNSAYCVEDGAICTCADDSTINEPRIAVIDGKKWLLIAVEEIE